MLWHWQRFWFISFRLVTFSGWIVNYNGQARLVTEQHLGAAEDSDEEKTIQARTVDQ
jgi:hypothetical protein